MSWGTELWDQYDSLSLHTQKGIDFLEKYSHFIKDRCAIETEYAGKLRRLVKNYQPKKKEEDDYQYTPCKAFRLMMNEINDLAGQHEVVAENLQASVIRDLTLLTKEIKEERKKQLNEGAKMAATLQTQEVTLERTRRNYEKAFREAERALENYQKADVDIHLSRAEVERQKSNMSMKSQQCEDVKSEYANQLQKTNDLRRSHFNVSLPEVFRQLQELDEKRINNIKNFIHNSVEIERNVFPIISKCLDGIDKAADLINEKEQSERTMSVTLHTDVGDIKLELYCEECPKTCENFLALCASDYYNGSLFHRNIKGFIVQTGDPSGTGKGGSSIWGKKFQDEFKEHIKHTQRGMVSMANNGPNTNGSQFFITYNAQPHLDLKYTLFGRVIDGFEGLDELEKLPVNSKNFRPITETRISSVTIHANPLAG